MRFPAPLADAEQNILLRAEELLTRRFNRVGEQQAITDPSVAGRIFQMRLAAHEREVFSVIFLNTRHRIIAIEDLHAGTIDGCEVHPRVVIQRALIHNSAAIIIGHNHPSTCIEPSSSDRALTARIKTAASLMDIRLLDSFVVASTGCTSMAARGWV